MAQEHAPASRKQEVDHPLPAPSSQARSPHAERDPSTLVLMTRTEITPWGKDSAQEAIMPLLFPSSSVLIIYTQTKDEGRRDAHT